MEFYQRVMKAKKENKVYAVATVVSTEGNTPRKSGAKMLVFADGSIHGSVGGGIVVFPFGFFCLCIKGEDAYIPSNTVLPNIVIDDNYTIKY